MSRRRFNWSIAIVILIASAVIVTTAFTLRKWQRNRMANSVFEAGLTAYDNRDWENAATNLGRYLVVDPTNLEILFKYAQSQLNRRPLKQNYVKQAVNSYRIILRNDKDNLQAVEKLASLYLQMNVAPEAQLIAERYLENNNNSEIELVLATALARQRKFEQAAAVLHKTIENDPANIKAYKALGLLSWKFSDQFQSKIANYWFDLAIEKNPQNMMAYISRAEFSLRDNKKTLALKDIENAEDFIAKDKEDTLEFVKILIKVNDFEKARKYLFELKPKAKSDLSFWQNWGVLALVSNNKDEMAMVAEQGLKYLHSPEKWDFMPFAAELLVNANAFDFARQCIKKLKNANLSPIETVFIEGQLARKQNQDHKAINLWEKAIQMGDTSEKTHLSIAMAWADVGNNQYAIIQLNKMILNNPESFKGHLLLAMLLSQTRDLDQALEHSRSAMQILPGNLEATLLNLQITMDMMKRQESGINENSWFEIEEKLAKIARSAEDSVEVKLTEAKLAIYLKKYDQAENLLNVLKTDHPDRMDIAIAEVDLLVAQKEIEPAVAKLHLIKEAFPQELSPVVRLASLLADNERIDDCQSLLTDAIDGSKSLREKRHLVMILAQYYEDWQEYEKAFNLLTDLSMQLPADVPLKIELLKNIRALGKEEEIKKVLDEIKVIESEHGWQWRCLQVGLWLEAADFMSRYVQMINMMKENILMNPTDQISRLLLAKTYEKAGKLQLAITTYKDALNRSPKDIRIIIPAVIAMYKAGEYQQAGEILDYAMMSEELKQKLARYKLQNCIGNGDYALAEDILSKLLIQTPDDLTMNLFFCWLKMRQGKLEEASEILNHLTDEQKETFSACGAMVNLSLLQGNKDKAIKISDEMVNRFQNASAYILRAKTYSLLGRNDQAIDNLDLAGKAEPDNVNVWITKSYLSLASGHFTAAVQAMEKASKLMPDDIQLKKHMVKVLLSCETRKYHLRGLKILDTCLLENPQDIQLRLYKAQYLLSKNTVPANKQARNMLQLITEQSPQNCYAWAVLVESYLRSGQSGLAMEAILKALTFSPGNSNLLILKAKVEAVHVPQLAIHTLKLLEQQHSGDVAIALTLAQMYSKLTNYNQAIEVLQNYPLNNAYPQDKLRIKLALAKALYKNDQINQATELLDSLYNSTDNKLEIFLTKSEILIEKLDTRIFFNDLTSMLDQNPDKMEMFIHFAKNLSSSNTPKANMVAEKVLQMVSDKNKASVKAKCMLADLLMLADRQDRAERLYWEILNHEPDCLGAINNLAWIICQQQGDYKQAFELTNKGLSYAPDYVNLIDTHGYILFKSGQVQNAVDNFNKCIDLYPSNSKLLAISYLHLADALVELSQNTKAIKNLEAALKVNSMVGGLSAVEINKAQELLTKLSQEINYGKITN